MDPEIIDQIVRLQPVYNESGSLLADSNYIICKCMFSHVHKYTHENAIIGLCTTCSAGNTRTIAHRKNAEKIFKVPFVIHTSVLDPVYYNAKLKIMIKCGEQLPDDCDTYKIVDLSDCDTKTGARILKSINYKPKWIKTALRDVNDSTPIEKLTR